MIENSDELLLLLFQIQGRCYDYFTDCRYSVIDSVDLADAHEFNSDLLISLTMWRILQSSIELISRIVLGTSDFERTNDIARKLTDCIARILFNVRHWGIAIWSQETLQTLCTRLLERDSIRFEPLVGYIFDLAIAGSQGIDRLDNRHAGNARLIVSVLKASQRFETMMKDLVERFRNRYMHSDSSLSLSELFTVSTVLCDARLSIWFSAYYDDILYVCLKYLDSKNGEIDSGILRVFTQVYQRVLDSKKITDIHSLRRTLPKLYEFIISLIQSIVDAAVRYYRLLG